MFFGNHQFDDLTKHLKIFLFISFQFIYLKEGNNSIVEIMDRSDTVFQHLFMMVISACIEIYVATFKESFDFL